MPDDRSLRFPAPQNRGDSLARVWRNDSLPAPHRERRLVNRGTLQSRLCSPRDQSRTGETIGALAHLSPGIRRDEKPLRVTNRYRELQPDLLRTHFATERKRESRLPCCALESL